MKKAIFFRGKMEYFQYERGIFFREKRELFKGKKE